MSDNETKDPAAPPPEEQTDKETDKEKEAAKEDEKEQDTSGTKSPDKLSTPGSKPASAKPSRAGSGVSHKSAGSAKSGASKASKPASRASRTGSPKGSARSGSPKGSARGGSPKGSARSGSPKGSARGSAKGSTTHTPKSSRATTPKGSVKSGKRSSGKRSAQEVKADTPAPEMPTVAGDPLGGDSLPAGVVPIFLSSQTQGIFTCKTDENVTTEMPFKIIPKDEIMNDLKMRAAVSDFAPMKQMITDYPGDEILVIYDADYKWGQNFCIATTEESKDKMLNPEGPEGEGGEGGEGREPEEEVIYKYVPPESKPWISLGSEVEVQEESVVESRKKIQVRVKRLRKEFGTPVEFTDRNVGDAKDAYIECTAYEDKTFDMNRIELDKGTQAIPEFFDTSSQTDWRYPRNAATQYYPREFNDEEKEEHLNSNTLKEFAENAVPRFELSLQQNEIMDVFNNDWVNLADGDSTFGSKADNHLKEYQSFTDLQFSKEKTITCIDWHPTIKGVLAVSVAERIAFDDRIDQSARIIMTPSLILIWSFADPIHPQLLLEAPDDIYSFSFCPTDPNIIAGGCMNGQVVLWDIAAHVDRLKQPRSSAKKKNAMNTLQGFEDESALETPIVRYAAVSSIEHSHKGAVTDILWVPDHLELTRMGVPIENRQQQCIQIMSCAVDHQVLVWDIRAPKTQAPVPDNKLKTPMGVPTTFRHLDLTWKPMLKVQLNKSEPGGDHSPTKFSLAERQGDRSVLSTGTTETKKEETSTMQGGYSFTGRSGSAKEKRTLQGVKTSFYCGTEDGEIVYVDWMPQKDQDTGKIQTPKPEFYSILHNGPVIALQRSPFFKDIVMCVGGWTFSIWKEGVNSGPILSSCAANKRLSGGFWSPSRPAVFFIARVDGSIDMWDLLDRTHEPSLNQNVTSSPITCIFPYAVNTKQHLLAVGDDAGTLHVMEIPWSLRQPTTNELQLMTNYFDREVKRRAFVVARWDFREMEKREIESEIKRKAGIAPNVTLTEDEVEYRMKQEYLAFVEEENAFLRELGLKVEEEEPLPET